MSTEALTAEQVAAIRPGTVLEQQIGSLWVKRVVSEIFARGTTLSGQPSVCFYGTFGSVSKMSGSVHAGETHIRILTE